MARRRKDDKRGDSVSGRVDRRPPWAIVCHEIRLTGFGREQFRLFCLLENADDEELLSRGLRKPAIAVITGMRKAWRTTFSERDYRRVRQLGEEHRANHPRRIAT